MTVETFKGDAKVKRKEKEKKIQKFIDTGITCPRYLTLCDNLS